VIRDPARADALGEPRDLPQVLGIERIRAADRERHAVEHDSVARGRALQHGERSAAGREEVLRHDLQEVGPHWPGQHAAVVLRAQADARAQRGQVEARSGGHVAWRNQVRAP
jgi:hypothetical protein